MNPVKKIELRGLQQERSTRLGGQVAFLWLARSRISVASRATCNAIVRRHAASPKCVEDRASRWAGLVSQWASFNSGTTFQSRSSSVVHSCRIRDEFNSDWSLSITSLLSSRFSSLTVSPTFLKFSGSSVSPLRLSHSLSLGFLATLTYELFKFNFYFLPKK